MVSELSSSLFTLAAEAHSSASVLHSIIGKPCPIEHFLQPSILQNLPKATIYSHQTGGMLPTYAQVKARRPLAPSIETEGVGSRAAHLRGVMLSSDGIKQEYTRMDQPGGRMLPCHGSGGAQR